jgi:hypothetical protein
MAPGEHRNRLLKMAETWDALARERELSISIEHDPESVPDYDERRYSRSGT